MADERPILVTGAGGGVGGVGRTVVWLLRERSVQPAEVTAVPTGLGPQRLTPAVDVGALVSSASGTSAPRCSSRAASLRSSSTPTAAMSAVP